MCADGFDYRTAAGLQRDRLAEAESIRRARKAKSDSRKSNASAGALRKKLGEQLIAIGEKLSAA